MSLVHYETRAGPLRGRPERHRADTHARHRRGHGHEAHAPAHRRRSGLQPIAPHVAAHECVDHNAGEYTRGNVSTNLAEGYFSQLKRSIDGTHHHVSIEHLAAYLTSSTSCTPTAATPTRTDAPRARQRRWATPAVQATHKLISVCPHLLTVAD